MPRKRLGWIDPVCLTIGRRHPRLIGCLRPIMKIDYLLNLDGLSKYYEDADVVDVKVFSRDDGVELSSGVETMVRVSVAQRRGCQSQSAGHPTYRPETARVFVHARRKCRFFIVHRAEEENLWISEIPDDNDLKAYFGVVQEPANDSMIYEFCTVSRKKH